MKTDSAVLTKEELAKALVSPVSVFDFPLEVVACPGLSRDQKIEILKRWELDARALQRATDENMGGGEPPLLDEVNRALTMLESAKRHARCLWRGPDENLKNLSRLTHPQLLASPVA